MPRMTRTQLNRFEYERRVNGVIDYISDHLAEELSVEQLARVAAFSAFHFHRVFKAIAKENLFEFIRRVRIERAAAVLKLNPAASITEVALNTGFSSSAVFSRAFKSWFGMSASQWRDGGANRWEQRNKAGQHSRTSGKPNSKGSKAVQTAQWHREITAPKPGAARTAPHLSVMVKDLPAFRVAYMRYVGPYGPGGISDTWQRFAAWMQAHGLISAATITLGIPQDDPGVADAAQCRYDCAVVVPTDFHRDRLVNLKEVPGGMYAMLPFRGSIPELVQAWDDLLENWLPDSGYQPDDRPFYELQEGPARMDPQGRVLCTLCIPVSPL